ncbi:release factor glutamine methyltransferase [Jannaschia pagri]|uniref:Release factor glutamine methyltransferase n=1 Tax=Jannaschia pagri TaxID=2829797 RepID=A0ABQ4NGC0_9RHOB|nr:MULTISPECIES: peptide chain release factor N(5)-glutamine methyltransferase [unclassified Jannaschia]GIT90422.1 release factor glutamine methyltransferase [Jannaschia sp. AI_61]GIT93473.1 release factor glutamine methyltransferase [Jannaschia sp. AI_62]
MTDPAQTPDAQQLLSDVRQRLEAAGVPDAVRDAAKLVQAAGAEDAAPLSDRTAATLEALVARRIAREPMSHILGRRAFWMHDFVVTPDVLDPRPDTETLVEAALEGAFDRILDLGTGSGCILASLLHERPRARGVGTDLSEAALAVAQQNLAQVGVADRAELIRSDWFTAVQGPFDLIVSNPPYITAQEMEDLSPEVLHEPTMALTPGGDGLSAYRAITAEAGRFLTSGGRLLVEIGAGQAGDVVAMFQRAGLRDIRVLKDLPGKDRVVAGQKST